MHARWHQSHSECVLCYTPHCSYCWSVRWPCGLAGTSALCDLPPHQKKMHHHLHVLQPGDEEMRLCCAPQQELQPAWTAKTSALQPVVPESQGQIGCCPLHVLDCLKPNVCRKQLCRAYSALNLVSSRCHALLVLALQGGNHIIRK